MNLKEKIERGLVALSLESHVLCSCSDMCFAPARTVLIARLVTRTLLVLLCPLLYPYGGQGLRGGATSVPAGYPQQQVFRWVFLGLAHHDGGKENRRRALQFLSDKEETAGTPSLRRETRRPHREEVICLGFLGIFRFSSGMVTKPTDHCHLVLVDGEHAPPGL